MFIITSIFSVLHKVLNIMESLSGLVHSINNLAVDSSVIAKI